MADHVSEDALLAHLCRQRFRELQRSHLRWAALASVPVWLEALYHCVPGALAWLAVLAQAAAVVLAAAYALLESRWRRRVVDLQGAPAGVVIHADWSDWDELLTALWSG